MPSSCRLNSFECLYNGTCVVNISANTTYCQCAPCREGDFCERDGWRQTQFDTKYLYFIIYIIGLCFSVLNNGLCLELFIRCKRIRRTNCGVYLIIYSILSLISSMLLVADGAVMYYPNQLIDHLKQLEIFDCVLYKIGYNMVFYLCIWFSSCVAFDRALIISFGSKMNGSRWRSFITTIVIFVIAGGSATPMLVYNCDWDNLPNLQIVRNFFTWFYIVVGIAIYVLATLLVLISFARRIRRYGMENNSCIKTFLKLLYKHLFIFIPPIAYGLSQIPYNIAVNTQNSNYSYLQCGISIGEYVIKVILETLTNIPIVITWLLFVYPSRVYMTEFYLNTWSGKCVAKILIFCKSINEREQY